MRYNYPDLIDFELYKIEPERLFFKIHDQNSELTCNKQEDGDTEGGLMFKSSSGYIIQSYDYPDVLKDVTYIRGYDVERIPDEIFYWSSRMERDLAYDHLLTAMTEFAASRGASLCGVRPEHKQLSLWD